MNICPITYQECNDERYSEKGLKQLSRTLSGLHFPYTAIEWLQEGVWSIQKMTASRILYNALTVLPPSNLN